MENEKLIKELEKIKATFLKGIDDIDALIEQIQNDDQSESTVPPNPPNPPSGGGGKP